MRDQEIRAALDQHWAASDANNFETEHRIYDEDAVLEYPQSDERTRGRHNIEALRSMGHRLKGQSSVGIGNVDDLIGPLDRATSCRHFESVFDELLFLPKNLAGFERHRRAGMAGDHSWRKFARRPIVLNACRIEEPAAW